MMKVTLFFQSVSCMSKLMFWIYCLFLINWIEHRSKVANLRRFCFMKLIPFLTFVTMDPVDRTKLCRNGWTLVIVVMQGVHFSASPVCTYQIEHLPQASFQPNNCSRLHIDRRYQCVTFAYTFYVFRVLLVCMMHEFSGQLSTNWLLSTLISRQKWFTSVAF